jgi:hypothetical protein
MLNLRAKTSLELVDSDNNRRGFLGYSTLGGTNFTLYNPNGVDTVRLQARATGSGGYFSVLHNNSSTVCLAQAQTNGGTFVINNTNEDRAGELYVGSAGGGIFNLYDSSGSVTINLAGQSGIITCVSVQQTSSRKVKENIKPIEDAKKILDLNAVSFDYKNKEQGTNKRGFIAEDVAEVLPNLVTPETEETPATLDYIGMIPYLQDVLKAQAAEIKELKAELAEIKNKVGG